MQISVFIDYTYITFTRKPS